MELLEKTGRRRAVQITIGVMWVFFGSGRLVEHSPRTLGWTFSADLPVLYGAGFVVTGILGLLSAFMQRWTSGRVGFSALVFMPLLLASSGFVSNLLWLVGSHVYSNAHGWVSGIIWTGLATVLMICSSWPEAHVQFPLSAKLERAARDGKVKDQ